MKMVSTRGVKFKFEKGEKVLCYEPDPTKAKVLYESKILDIGIRKDKLGRKFPEYFVHFNGWNSSWDRCVTEELILEDNEQNRALQQLLAQQAIVKLKNKKKRKLIEALMTDRRNKNKNAAKSDASEYKFTECPKRENSNGKSVKLTILENLLRIPERLTKQLENDFLFIKNVNKLVRLPCEPNVIFILEDYVQSFIQSSLQSAKKPGSHDDCDKRLKLCKEVVDGLRIYFDFTLPNLLLYNSEKKQYEDIIKDFKPSSVYKQRNPSTASTATTCDTVPCQNSLDIQSGDPLNDLKMENCDSESCQTQEITDTSSQGESCDVKSSRLTVKSDDSLMDKIRGTGESCCSSKKVTYSNASLKFNDSLSCCPHCQEAKTWRLLPSVGNENEPAAPSLIYGAHHLLRLFVKLPDLLSRSTMPVKKIRLLGKHLQTFLRYMDDKYEDFFQDCDYMDSKGVKVSDSKLVR